MNQELKDIGAFLCVTYPVPYESKLAIELQDDEERLIPIEDFLSEVHDKSIVKAFVLGVTNILLIRSW